MTTGRRNRSYIFSILTILLSLIVAIFIIEIAIRSFYYQVNAPYSVGIYHFYVHKLVPWFETGFRSAGKKLNREAWEASYAERSMPVPASGPREGYWGARIFPKNHDDCGYLRYCEGERSLPGLIEIDHQGMQHAGRRDESDVHILIVGGSVAFGAYASSVENTYFERLRKALNKHSVDVSISVLAAGAWVSGDEVAAFAEIGLKLTPDLVIFLNGLNDLTIPMYPVGELNPQERVRYYLRNMSTAGVLAKRSGVTVVYALQPYLPSKKHKTDLEKTILAAAFPQVTHPRLEPIRQGLRRLANDFEGYFVDLSNVMDDEIYTTFADPYHFSDPGHELLAEALAQAILPVLKSRNPKIFEDVQY